VTTVSVRFLPRERKVQVSSPPVATPKPTPVHLNQTGRGTDDHVIQCGFMMYAISPAMHAAPTGRNVKRMKRPSCRRSSLSPVADLAR